MNRSRWKRAKFGMLPGDYPHGIKINMLEKNGDLQLPQSLIIKQTCKNTFRKEHKLRAKLQDKARANKEIKEETNE